MRLRSLALRLLPLALCLPSLGCGGPTTSVDGGARDGAVARDANTTPFDAGPAESCDTPGALEEVPCGECGRVQRFCNSERVWSYVDCISPPTCTPPTLECDTPGALETVACGVCGEQERFCNADRLWVPGACTERGTCAPGATRNVDCGLCATRGERCTDACEWEMDGVCEGGGECAPGEERRLSDGCVPAQTRLEVCDSACSYQPAGGCEGPIVPMCPTDTMLCGERCVDVRSDADHCGACDLACQPGAECVSTRCECEAPLEPCGASATCVDTSVSATHCGACGVRCPTGASCVDGGCVCPSGQTLCNGACRTLSNDPNNCGFCGARCLASGTCGGGRCSGPSLTECLPKPAGWASCNAYCASIGRTCDNECGGTGLGGAYGRYFDESCTMINGVFGTCSESIQGSSSINGFRCCCVP